ncbi:MAG: carbohydrate kinase family protein [Actinomycetia bacterium]|nr:carbohydrate kinase family protein [Actinomycetes bacterium]
MPGQRSGVLCAGSLVVDHVKEIDRFPAPEELAVIDRLTVCTGGPAQNMAVDLRRLGAPFPVGVIGAVGDDANAEVILGRCRERGIDTTGVRAFPGVATSFTDCMVEHAGGGRRTFFHHIGAAARLDVSDFPIERTAARVLHIGAPGIHPLMDAPAADGNGWTKLLRRARAAGLHTNMELVSLDPRLQADAAGPCLPHLSSVVINELEAAALVGVAAPPAGLDAPDWPALESIALDLVDRGVSTLAVVHFPAGCVAAAPGGFVWRQGSVRLASAQVRNTTGAGDAFAAGVILGLHEHWAVEDCLRLGAASAAACIRSDDTNDGIDDAATCLAAADAIGYRQTHD